MADGRLLSDVDAQLLEETVAALLGGQVSPVFFVPSRDEAVLIVERLRAARIESRCECEKSDCRTYRFVVAEKPDDVGFLNLRLIARGEMRLVLDSDGDIHKLERLYDPERDGVRGSTHVVRYTWFDARGSTHVVRHAASPLLTMTVVRFD